jgi:hypothetical protein
MPRRSRTQILVRWEDTLVFSAAVALLFANTFLMLLPESAGMYFLPKGLPETARWYRNNSITIQFVLLLLLAVILVKSAFTPKIPAVEINVLDWSPGGAGAVPNFPML